MGEWISSRGSHDFFTAEWLNVNNKIVKVSSKEYTDVPKVHFTPLPMDVISNCSYDH